MITFRTQKAAEILMLLIRDLGSNQMVDLCVMGSHHFSEVLHNCHTILSDCSINRIARSTAFHRNVKRFARNLVLT